MKMSVQLDCLGEVKKYRDKAHASCITEAIHLSLFLPIQQVIVVLHACELGPSILFGTELHLRKLRGPHARGTNVTYFAGLDNVVESFHCFFDWSVFVKSMNLQKVDVRSVQAFQ
jgi:hypothetical protein